ncbi:unnamed protein product [Dicrocoelium dendriticum]|nr:unnamed protein product [Dicrocoelium dendriticum]
MVQLDSWVNFWDKTPDLLKNETRGIAVHERLNKFLAEFSKLQNDAFSAQKKLCEKYVVDTAKCFGVDNSYASAVNEFLRITQLLIDTEGLISGSFEIQTTGDFKNGIEDEKRRLKRWKHDRERLTSEMKMQTRIIEDEMKRYRDKYREMVKATEDFLRIDADKSHSQADVEKASTFAHLRTKDFERARRDYEAALNQFNLYRRDHFNRTLPLWAQVGYQLGRDRYSRTQTLLNTLSERIRVAMERMNTVCSELRKICDTFELDRDIDRFLSCIRSGIPCPGDIAFVDLAAMHPMPSQSTCLESVAEKSATFGDSKLPPNFYASVSAADLAALEQAGLTKDSPNDGPMYAGTSSLYSTFSAVVNSGLGATSRRPSINSRHNPGSPSGYGHGILRRFFSRRSRSVTNMKPSYNGAGVSELSLAKESCTRTYRSLVGSNPSSRVRDLLDSSDFSDTSFESGDNQRRDENANATTNAYASTSVLIGIKKEDMFGSEAPASSPQDQPCPHHTAPLAEPEPNPFIQNTQPLGTESQPGVAKNSQHLLNGHPVSRAYDENFYRRTTADLHAKARENGCRSPRKHPSPIATDKRIPHPSSGSFVRLPPLVIAQKLQNYCAVRTVDTRPSSIGRVSESSNPANFSGKMDRVDANSRNKPGSFEVSEQPSSEHNANLEANSATSSPSISYDRHSNSRTRHGPDEHYYPRKSAIRAGTYHEATVIVGYCVARYDFSAEGFESCYLPFTAGEKFYMVAPSASEDTSQWLHVMRCTTRELGYVPTGFVEQQLYAQPSVLPAHAVSGGESNAISDQDVSSRGEALFSRSNVHSPIVQARTHRSPTIGSPVFTRLASVSNDTEL